MDRQTQTSHTPSKTIPALPTKQVARTTKTVQCTERQLSAANSSCIRIQISDSNWTLKSTARWHHTVLYNTPDILISYTYTRPVNPGPQTDENLDSSEETVDRGPLSKGLTSHSTHYRSFHEGFDTSDDATASKHWRKTVVRDKAPEAGNIFQTRKGRSELPFFSVNCWILGESVDLKTRYWLDRGWSEACSHFRHHLISSSPSAMYCSNAIEWVSRGLTSYLTHHSSFHGRFYGQGDSTNNVKALKEASWPPR